MNGDIPRTELSKVSTPAGTTTGPVPRRGNSSSRAAATLPACRRRRPTPAPITAQAAVALDATKNPRRFRTNRDAGAGVGSRSESSESVTSGAQITRAGADLPSSHFSAPTPTLTDTNAENQDRAPDDCASRAAAHPPIIPKATKPAIPIARRRRAATPNSAPNNRDAISTPLTSSGFWPVPKVWMLHSTMPPGVSSTNTPATPRTSDGIFRLRPDSSSPVPNAAAAARKPDKAATFQPCPREDAFE